MSEMVKRVARAIEAVRDYKEDISIRATPEELARAAIAAMREPTEAMTGSLRWFGEDDLELWQLMIDAALKE